MTDKRTAVLDVASYLPYRGEVTLSIKAKNNLSVRIPNWVEKEKVEVSVDGRSQQLVWLNNYLVLAELLAGSEVTVRFPMVESTETHAVDSFDFCGAKHLGRHNYTVTFLGNTAIDITPRGGGGHATFERLHYRNADVPLIDVNDYVPQERIAW